MSAIALPRLLSEWVARTYPGHPYAYWGQSGAALLWDALLQARRKTIMMPAFICPSLPAAAVAAGLRVVFVDVDPSTLLPSLQVLEECLVAHADEEAVLLVDHSFGYPLSALANVRRHHPLARTSTLYSKSRTEFLESPALFSSIAYSNSLGSRLPSCTSLRG